MATPDTPAIGHDADQIRHELWKRGLFTLVLMLLFGVSQGLLFMTAAIQFFWLLFVKEPNAFLLRFGSSLALWLAEAARFLSCVDESKPFPWKEWPRTD